MKKNSIKYIITIIFLIVLYSCEEKFVMDKPETVLHGLVFEGQSPKIILAKTLDPFPEYAFDIKYYDQPFYIDEYITNIDIMVTCDGKVYNNFEMEIQVINQDEYSSQTTASNEIIYFSDKSFIPEAGKECIIEINEIPNPYGYEIGFDYLKSKTYIPEKIPITIEQQNDVINSDHLIYLEDTVYNFVYTISFDDPGNTNDYYYLTLSKVESEEDFSMDTVNMDQLWLDKEYYFPSLWLTNIYYKIDGLDFDHNNSYYGSDLEGFLFNDETFNGQTKNIQLELFNYFNMQEGTRYLVAELMHISKDYYNYFTTIQKQTISQNDIFAEPTQLYTNIEGGLGIFAGASMSTNNLKIISKPE